MRSAYTCNISTNEVSFTHVATARYHADSVEGGQREARGSASHKQYTTQFPPLPVTQRRDWFYKQVLPIVFHLRRDGILILHGGRGAAWENEYEIALRVRGRRDYEFTAKVRIKGQKSKISDSSPKHLPPGYLYYRESSPLEPTDSDDMRKTRLSYRRVVSFTID